MPDDYGTASASYPYHGDNEADKGIPMIGPLQPKIQQENGEKAGTTILLWTCDAATSLQVHSNRIAGKGKVRLVLPSAATLIELQVHWGVDPCSRERSLLLGSLPRWSPARR